MPQASKHPAVYIMTNRKNGTLYTGVTSNLVQRVWQHRAGSIPGFTTRYALKHLVWFESHATMEHAILCEKQLKGGSRGQEARPDHRAEPRLARPLRGYPMKPAAAGMLRLSLAMTTKGR